MKTPFPSVLLSGLLFLPLALLADTPRTDSQIQDAIKSSYTYHTVLNNNVKVDVDNGVVTLTGTVRDEEQSRVAEDTAAAMDGVTRVDNKLKVEDTAKQGSDEWIALKVRSRLLVKANVSLANTQVNVKDGVVMLTGTADTNAQKELTEEYVKDIDGVRSVTNNIEVVEPAAASASHPTMGDKIDDSSITAQVKYELFSHRSTSAIKTKVSTFNGHVVISGDASSGAEKDLVTKLAKSVRGVDSVENNMVVRD